VSCVIVEIGYCPARVIDMTTCRLIVMSSKSVFAGSVTQSVRSEINRASCRKMVNLVLVVVWMVSTGRNHWSFNAQQ